MRKRTRRSASRVGAPLGVLILAAGSLAGLGSGVPLTAQTIRGNLIDAESNAPIPLGLVLMHTEVGDSVTSTITDAAGRFEIRSDEAGSFVLRAAALGYDEDVAGVFDLGVGGSLTIEYRLSPAPLPLDALLVSVDRPVLDHHLVRNGFVRRLQRGLGKFITPHDIEESPARSTEDLLIGMPAVRVGPVMNGGLPSPALGDNVQIVGPLGGLCNPTVYVDGMRRHYDPGTGFTLTTMVSIADIEAMEVYRRPAEIPVEFGVESIAGASGSPGVQRGCGVMVLWTKTGLAPGQRGDPSLDRTARDAVRELPAVEAVGDPPMPGERVRVELDPRVSARVGLTPVWEGTFLTTNGAALVAQDPILGRAVSIPVEGVEALHVSRVGGRTAAVRRGALVGAGFALGMWGFLEILCAQSCGFGSEQSNVVPALAGGVFVGGLAALSGPGPRWVAAPLPAPPPAPGGVSLSLRFPR